jgi:A/G-specific adenine glycosylase
VKNNSIAKELTTWYTHNKRDLPWRDIDDPYKIWLSEVILQQTRVDQGLPYYNHFVEKYPTVFHLAEARLDDVLRSWQGLGYYSRARNLHKCAKTIVNNYSGKFPPTRNELIKLPGIGPYTSAAIASFAFGEKEAVVDGNVIRVISRLYGIEDDIADLQTSRQIKMIVDELIPSSDPALFNQAIMEFGALHCTPKKPLCSTCGFLGICDAQKSGRQEKIPIKLRKTKKRFRYFNYLIIKIQDKFLFHKRKEKDIWNELFEFFLVETTSEISFDKFQLPPIITHNPTMWKITEESITYKHLLSHQTIVCRFYEIDMSKDFKFYSVDWEDYQLYSKEEINDLPKSTLINRYLEEKN